MLCTVCDNITFESLNRPHGYEHMPSFHALQASADGGLCSLCDILWTAVDTNRVQEAKDRQENGGDEEEDDVLLMEFPVRLTVDGMIWENEENAIEKFKNSESRWHKSGGTWQLYNLHTAKAPAVLFVCSLQPDNFKLGLKLRTRGSVSLYREPRKNR